jgi:hypothetical protein
MSNALLDELHRLRNEIAHGQRRPDPDFLAKRLRELGISVPAGDMQWFVASLLRGFGGLGEYFVPPVVLDVVRGLLAGYSANFACDPWAGLGVLAAVVHEATHARETFAFSPSQSEVVLGKTLTPQIDWQVGDPLALLEGLVEPIDVFASVVPFGMRITRPVDLRTSSGESVRCGGELGPILVAAACLRLSAEGVGIFVVTPSFFSQDSILRDLPRLGLGVEASLALPAGSFAPFTKLSAYLIVVRKRTVPQMFVAQLSQEDHTNWQIVDNLRKAKADGTLDLGRFVAPENFHGLEPLRVAEDIRRVEDGFGAPAIRLEELATAIRLGRPDEEFEFPNADNALYVPLIGISDVVDSSEEMTLKRQNYAQIVVDPARSDARFVARFLNSELGRSIRQANKSGSTIPKLNTTGLKGMAVLIPNLHTQKNILRIAGRLTAEQNTLLGLQNDLAALGRDLWINPARSGKVEAGLRALSDRLAAGATSHVASTLDQWFESLPFPLASILRAWQATPNNDLKTKYEHLLHFFEAAAEFLSVIFLSAFSSQKELFAGYREKLTEAWRKQNLSLERPTFGTWKVVVEYFSKQTRVLLAGDTESRALCAELFGDPSNALPEMLARTELATVLATTNKMRNDWIGHGGVVSQEEAGLRNEQLLTEVQKFREAMAEGWSEVQLVRALHCLPHGGVFDNQVAVLVGSNSEFLKESLSMSMWLDIEELYLVHRHSKRALRLLPLVQVGPSPVSAKNACYFFNRVEKDGIRFVSYHFVDRPELKDRFDAASDAIRFLSEMLPSDDH